MPRKKNQTNSWWKCAIEGCKHPMMFANRINIKYNPKNKGLKLNKYCPNCKTHTEHDRKNITSKGSTKAK